jgi:nitrate/nitrite transporter NarK
MHDSKEVPKGTFKAKFRWLMLFLITLYIFGPMYIWGNPYSMELPLLKDFKMHETQYSVLYAVYYFPNMVIPMFNAFII